MRWTGRVLPLVAGVTAAVVIAGVAAVALPGVSGSADERTPVVEDAVAAVPAATPEPAAEADEATDGDDSFAPMDAAARAQLEAEKVEPDVTVEAAAKAAKIHDFVVQSLSAGYETKVGERGIRLSGGQRQRIGIARALYHNPDVLILDEATSSLDVDTEAEVQAAISGLKSHKTIIIVAHRMTTVAGCDRLFCLSDGRLIADDGILAQ